MASQCSSTSLHGQSQLAISFNERAKASVACITLGLRVVMVQTVGMAVIAALIGAGGFGALVFQGLLSSAIDLVLLGVIPVIVLAVLTDALFDLLIALLKVKRND